MVPSQLVETEQPLKGFCYGINGEVLVFQVPFAGLLLLIYFRNSLRIMFRADKHFRDKYGREVGVCEDLNVPEGLGGKRKEYKEGYISIEQSE
jgi:hypothetical protein